ncbi:cytochrome P450, partial [Cylindrobasidium torrendii FP15055 ss-10]
ILRLPRSAVARVRGPDAPSWLVGHEEMLNNQEQVGTLELQWAREYGSVFRLKGCFGENILMLSDAKAIQHVLHTSGYRFRKAASSEKDSHDLFGGGILVAQGAAHSRQRKIMNPSFSHSQLKTFSRLFQAMGGAFAQKMVETVGDGAAVNVHRWLGRFTLDVIGRAAFGYDFAAVEDTDNELTKVMNTLLYVPTCIVDKGKYTYILDWVWGHLPVIARRAMDVFPTKQSLRYRHFREMSSAAAKEILDDAKGTSTTYMSGKDILSVLVRANEAEDLPKKLTEDEVLSQAATMILAGHETSASTLTWILYELSARLDIQTKIREEISSIRDRYPVKGEVAVHEYEGMETLNAVIKETLRIHPIVFKVQRVSNEDDILPLSEPIVNSIGETVTEIAVPKGQFVHVAIGAYNRNKSVWGEDADIWRPERWVESQSKRPDNSVSVGVLSNLVTFSGGVRSCIGWRFALMEMQVLLVELLETFQIERPVNEGVIKRYPAAGLMLPIVEGALDKGVNMPLKLTPL